MTYFRIIFLVFSHAAQHTPTMSHHKFSFDVSPKDFCENFEKWLKHENEPILREKYYEELLVLVERTLCVLCPRRGSPAHQHAQCARTQATRS